MMNKNSYLCAAMRYLIPILCFLLSVAAGACGGDIPRELAEMQRTPLYDWADPSGPVLPDTAPDGGCVRMYFRGLPSLGRLFNDSNHVHLAAAEAIGVRPVTDLRSAWESGEGLVKIASCDEYYLAPLSHSYPFLVPEAADALREIGARFADSLEARGGGAYRPKVTSVFRTPHTVGRLRRVNRNATGNSAHQYASTFDISYSKFICDDTTATHRTYEDLKNLLATVLRAMRDEGRIYVKHERKQSCFHITARPLPEATAAQNNEL